MITGGLTPAACDDPRKLPTRRNDESARGGPYDGSMAVHLVRHARAGDRERSDEPDELRPLTKKGERQARALVDQFADVTISRVLSSRYLRCRQTVEPLAEHVGLPIEEHSALLETADLEDLWSLIETLIGAPGDVVMCTHGNLIGPVIDRLHRRGVPIDSPDRDCSKGSTWTIESGSNGAFARAAYTPPTLLAD